MGRRRGRRRRRGGWLLVVRGTARRGGLGVTLRLLRRRERCRWSCRGRSERTRLAHAHLLVRGQARPGPCPSCRTDLSGETLSGQELILDDFAGRRCWVPYVTAGGPWSGTPPEAPQIVGAVCARPSAIAWSASRNTSSGVEGPGVVDASYRLWPILTSPAMVHAVKVSNLICRGWTPSHADHPALPSRTKVVAVAGGDRSEATPGTVRSAR